MNDPHLVLILTEAKPDPWCMFAMKMACDWTKKDRNSTGECNRDAFKFRFSVTS